MIQSTFINDILDLLLDGDDDGLLLRKQLPFLTESLYNYTGSGFFVHFLYSEKIYNFRLQSETTLLDGITIKSHLLYIKAEASIYIKDGIIEYLEVWCKTGNYPSHELTTYLLEQTWDIYPSRSIVKL